MFQLQQVIYLFLVMEIKIIPNLFLGMEIQIHSGESLSSN